MPNYEAIGRCVEAEKVIKRYTAMRSAAIDQMIQQLLAIKSSGESFEVNSNLNWDELFELYSAAYERGGSSRKMYAFQPDKARQLLAVIEEAETKLIEAISLFNQHAPAAGESSYEILIPWEGR